MAGAFADPAVSNNGLGPIDGLGPVNAAKLIGGLKSSIVITCFVPWDVAGAGCGACISARRLRWPTGSSQDRQERQVREHRHQTGEDP